MFLGTQARNWERCDGWERTHLDNIVSCIFAPQKIKSWKNHKLYLKVSYMFMFI